jgi:hypothetical protein
MSGGITSSIANDTIQKQLFTTHCETPSGKQAGFILSKSDVHLEPLNLAHF